jgi:hypothetical protein
MGGGMNPAAGSPRSRTHSHHLNPATPWVSSGKQKWVTFAKRRSYFFEIVVIQVHSGAEDRIRA